MGWNTLGEILFLLVSAVTIAAILERFKISSIIGYLLGGMLVGPGMLGLVGAGESDTGRFEVMTELGVSLLLFTIGLEITPAKIRLFGIRGGIIGIAQILGTLVVVMGIFFLMRDPNPSTAFAIGCMVTLSSTAVVMRILADRTEVDSSYGRDAMAILLLQDLAVVPMLIIIGMMGEASEITTESPKITDTTFTMLIGVGALILIAVFVLPRLLGSNVFRRNRDFPVILALTTALTAAWASHAIGLSAELGAFMAGIILARTDFARQMRADVAAMKSIFLTLFFASVGLLADVGWVLADWHWIQVILICAVGITLKAIIIAVVVILTGGRIRTAVRTGLTISQIGEFSFVIGTIAFGRGLLNENGFQMLVSATLLSLLATPGLIAIAEDAGIFVERILQKMGFRVAPFSKGNESSNNMSGHVVVAGFGPSGEEAARTARLAGHEILVVDLNPVLVQKARSEGFHAEIGNSTQLEILEHMNLGSARALVVTLPDPSSVISTIEQARSMAGDLVIVARARYRRVVSAIEKAGADHVLSEEGVIGTVMGSTVVSLLDLDIPDTE
ncbi:MAG: cation:proton antiporter [Phycisphaerales bacterium]|nr:cation:proton antiporter [Phycisphaerales bacterium]